MVSIVHNQTVISPSAMLDIIGRIEKTLWDKFDTKKYQNVKRYIARWHEVYDGFGEENFSIIYQPDSDNIDLSATLDTMEDELLFKLAVDLNIEVPGLIYSVAEIKGILAEKYEDVGQTFQKAHEKIFSDPSTAIIMANSALERIIKKICADGSIDTCNAKDGLFKLANHILKQFGFLSDPNLNANIRNIGSGLLNTSQAIENIRSKNTEAHGTEDEIISDPIYAMLVVNAVSTVGLFLLNYHEKHYQSPTTSSDDDLPF